MTILVSDSIKSTDDGLSKLLENCPEHTFSVSAMRNRVSGKKGIGILIIAGISASPPRHADPSGLSRASRQQSSEPPFVLVIQCAMMHGQIPRPVLEILCDAGTTLVTWDWEDGGKDSMRSLLNFHCGIHSLPGMGTPGLQRHIDLGPRSHMSLKMWETAVFPDSWERPLPDKGYSYMVGLGVHP